ncbi:MAG: RsmE family RNA methyltransferase [Anaerolineaceae bacterium]
MRPRSNLPRFFVDPTSIDGSAVTFPEGISHQISQVLRLDLNQDEVIVLDGSGAAYLMRLNGKSGRVVSAGIVEQFFEGNEELADLTLCFSLTRREKVEWVLQKCTEIGVSRFQPFVSERSVSRLESLDDNRRTRWEAIIREAAEQSERNRLPELLEVVRFEDIVDKVGEEEQKLMAYEGADSANKLRQLPLKQAPVVLLIGPEGGFSDEEAGRTLGSGFQQFSLGKRILRMETACMIASALVLDRLGTIAADCD